jgi:hypothetical protein
MAIQTDVSSQIKILKQPSIKKVKMAEMGTDPIGA